MSVQSDYLDRIHDGAPFSTDPEPGKWTADEVRYRLLHDDRWLIRGLMALYRQQTIAERQTKTHLERNGRGFSPFDVAILSTIAAYCMVKHGVTGDMIVVLRRTLPKYAGQLAKIANGEIEDLPEPPNPPEMTDAH